MPSNNPNGRPRGSVNKQSAKLITYIDEKGQGVSPGMVMLDAMWFHFSRAGSEMRKPEADRDMKAIGGHLETAASLADRVAPYVHTKLAAVTVLGDEDNPLRHEHSVKGAPPKLTDDQIAGLPTAELVQRYRMLTGGVANDEPVEVAPDETPPIEPTAAPVEDDAGEL